MKNRKSDPDGFSFNFNSVGGSEMNRGEILDILSNTLSQAKVKIASGEMTEPDAIIWISQELDSKGLELIQNSDGTFDAVEKQPQKAQQRVSVPSLPHVSVPSGLPFLPVVVGLVVLVVVFLVLFLVVRPIFFGGGEGEKKVSQIEICRKQTCDGQLSEAWFFGGELKEAGTPVEFFVKPDKTLLVQSGEVVEDNVQPSVVVFQGRRVDELLGISVASAQAVATPQPTATLLPTPTSSVPIEDLGVDAGSAPIKTPTQWWQYIALIFLALMSVMDLVLKAQKVRSDMIYGTRGAPRVQGEDLMAFLGALCMILAVLFVVCADNNIVRELIIVSEPEKHKLVAVYFVGFALLSWAFTRDIGIPARGVGALALVYLILPNKGTGLLNEILAYDAESVLYNFKDLSKFLSKSSPDADFSFWMYVLIFVSGLLLVIDLLKDVDRANKASYVGIGTGLIGGVLMWVAGTINIYLALLVMTLAFGVTAFVRRTDLDEAVSLTVLFGTFLRIGFAAVPIALIS